MGLAILLALVVAPEDADQGVSQRIFYIHVPIALTAYFCFGLGAWKALLLLWRGGERYDLASYVAIHQGTIFGSLTLITGSLWAKASWGVWWTWDSNQLVLFLVLFLFYCAYFMLRFSLPEGPRRARSSAVYALFGVVLIPISFLAIRLAEDFIHPAVFTREGPQMSASMFVTFCVSWAAVTLLASSVSRGGAGKRWTPTCEAPGAGWKARAAVGAATASSSCRGRIRRDKRCEAHAAAPDGRAAQIAQTIARKAGSASGRRLAGCDVGRHSVLRPVAA
jgi:heme exporter protein C